MKRFVKEILSLLIFILIINGLIFLVLTTRVDSRFNNYYRILDKIKSTEYDILITGDSHANDCWNGFENKRVLDLTFPGDNYLDINRKLIYLENQGIVYGKHIVEIDRHMLNDYRNNINNNDLSIYFSKNKVFLKIQRFFPLFFNSNLKAELKASFYPTSSNSDENNLNEVITKESIKNKASEQFWQSDLNKNMCTNLELIVEHSKLKSIEVIFLSYPLYSEYKNAIDTCKSFIDASKYIHQIVENNNLRYISSENMFCNKKWFFNQDHLNQSGGAIAQEHYINLFYNSSAQEIISCIDNIVPDNE
jgi:hypothetical protein